MSEMFSWSLPGLNRRQFTAFANLLALRNGGQVEPASLCDELLDQDNLDDDSDGGSIDTSRPRRISDSGHDRLKRKFLDCLAEIAANKKGGESVACSAMREAEESVALWITRNEGFQTTDRPWFDKLGEILRGISCNKESRPLDESLWNHMLAYHELRLEGSYIPNLKSSLKAWKSLVDIGDHNNFATALHELTDLRSLIFDLNSHKLVDRHSKLAIKAYELRKTRTIEELLQTSPHSTAQSRKLWGDICFLSRLRVAFENFRKTALKLPSFRKVTITLVPRDTVPLNSLEDALNLRQVIELLRLPFNTETIKSAVNHKWSITKSEEEFTKRQKQKLNIHAEVQMILFLSRDEESFTELLLYFGCSKYSCFMCSHFLQSHGKFSTRGCHGRLFKPWTVPEASKLAPGQADRISKAVMQVQKDIEKELKSEVKKDIQHVKTSVIGGSSIFTEIIAEESGRQTELEWRRLKVEQDRVAEWFKRQSLTESSPHFEDRITTHLSGNNSLQADELVELDECYCCSRLTSRLCSICGKDAFCSQRCEEKRSGRHIFTCRKRSLTSADYLYRSIATDELPEDEDVLEDFGFGYFTSFADKCNLLGLYKGLYLSDEITVEDVHKWQVEGSLVTNIKNYFHQIPENCRGGYFPWFLNHTNIFDQRITKEDATRKLVETFYDQARPYLEEEDRHKKPNELVPEAKKEAYHFLAQALHMASPNPIDSAYYTFGFCTCRNEQEEKLLCGLYLKLLLSDKLFSNVPSRVQLLDAEKSQTAIFTEFWNAYESGSLIQLMDSKGLEKLRIAFPFLERFLSFPPSGQRPSVWYLKQFIAANSPADLQPQPEVIFDYGFFNCQTFEETCILLQIYQRLLSKANPLELHKACLDGKLFEFAQRIHIMDEDYKRLMKNIH